MQKYNGFQIKVFMVVLMVFDHLSIIPGLVPPMTEGNIHLLTRCVGVWFAYMAVEGFLHTRNQIRYNGRLFLWAIITGAGNQVVNLVCQSAGVGGNLPADRAYCKRYKKIIITKPEIM